MPQPADSGCLIALGSNLGISRSSPVKLLEQAFVLLKERNLVIRSRSRFFSTPAFPAGAGPDFVNAAAILDTSLEPVEILAALHAVETQMGRTRKLRWGARTLDLDLIAVRDLVLPDAKTQLHWRSMELDRQMVATPPELILPHPRLAERAFVLVPLLDIAPDWRHPLTGASVREMHDALPKALRDEVVAF